MDTTALLMFVHVASAIVWAGGVFATAWFIVPAAKSAGAGAGPFMGALVKGRLRPVMLAASALTAIAGLWLWTRLVDGAPTGLEGTLLSLGALAGLVAVGIGHGFQNRTGKAIVALVDEMKGSPPNQEQGARMTELQGEMAKYGTWLMWLMCIAIVGMTLGGA